MSREKVTPEERIMAAKDCAEGHLSQAEAARRLGVNESAVRGWVQRYKANGALEFRVQEQNTVYAEELKLKAVKEYLYLSAILDLYDRRIVSFIIHDSNDLPLVFDTLDAAVKAYPNAHPLFHSDRGFQ